MTTLTHLQAERFYDRFGAKQDWQAFYENPAIEALLAQCAFPEATHLVELGAGTGRVAERILAELMPSGARYSGFDNSQTMVDLAAKRLQRFGAQARVVKTSGTLRLDLESQSADRFIATYVLDLLSPEDIAEVMSEARRILVPGGLAGFVSLTYGETAFAKIVERLWWALYRRHPNWLGGCRPIRLADFVEPVEYQGTVTAFGVTSEIVVVRK